MLEWDVKPQTNKQNWLLTLWLWYSAYGHDWETCPDPQILQVQLTCLKLTLKEKRLQFYNVCLLFHCISLSVCLSVCVSLSFCPFVHLYFCSLFKNILHNVRFRIGSLEKVWENNTRSVSNVEGAYFKLHTYLFILPPLIENLKFDWVKQTLYGTILWFLTKPNISWMPLEYTLSTWPNDYKLFSQSFPRDPTRKLTLCIKSSCKQKYIQDMSIFN